MANSAPKLTSLILVRHGATHANLGRPYTLQGLRPDSDLAEEGYVEACAVGRAVRGMPIAAVYSSPLKRAATTAELIADHLGLAVQAEGELMEADVGVWAGLSWQQVEQRWPAEWAAFQNDPEVHGYVQGENFAAVRRRVVPPMNTILERHRGQTVLVVGHGLVNRVLLAHWLGLPLRHARRLPQDNGGMTTVDFDGPTARVRTLNAIDHLLTLSHHQSPLVPIPHPCV